MRQIIRESSLHEPIRRVRLRLIESSFYVPVRGAKAGKVRVERFVRERRAYETIRRLRVRTATTLWRIRGCPTPPSEWVKRSILLSYTRRFHTNVFIETGTFLGETVAVMRWHVGRVISIELDEDLYRQAERRFHGDPRVSIVHGDSADVLPMVLEPIQQPALFWLDGHYSGGITAHGPSQTPVLSEIKHVLSLRQPNHVILIDDARKFTGDAGYPSISELESLTALAFPDHHFEVRDDIIRIHRP